MAVNPTELEQAVAAWIRAEWEFRFGPHSYTFDRQEWCVQAERKLRQALTGKRDLPNAYEKLKGGR